jgi:hypothetical protein
MQRKVGFVLLLTGIILNTAGIATTRQLVGDNAMLYLGVIGFVFIIIGGYLVYRGGQYAAKALAREIDDSTPTVLYLRPFKTDVKMGKFIFMNFYYGGVRTKEEQLAEVLQSFGPLLAIGHPGETLPLPGAAKIYAADDWKKVVMSKMKTSRLVVILAGTGEGLLWELREAFEIVDPRKLLIMIPTMSKKAYEAFCAQAARTFDVHFPEAGKMKGIAGVGIGEGFIRFAADWTSGFLPLKTSFLRTNPYSPYLYKFKLALRPVFEDYGIEWSKPRYSLFIKITLGIVGVLVLFIVLIILLASLHV